MLSSEVSQADKVSIHAPREGCDEEVDKRVLDKIWFQFTHPGRGATEAGLPQKGVSSVSIHAPREGCDNISHLAALHIFLFQFTHPGRGATAKCTGEKVASTRFNSRTPGGVRPCTSCWCYYEQRFNSRTPGGVRLHLQVPRGLHQRVSIHAPREGCDAKHLKGVTKVPIVSIHAPREGCDCKSTAPFFQLAVSIHAPREGCDRR